MAEKSAGLKIVSVGGGTGLSTLLSGLKAYVHKESVSHGSTPAHKYDSWIETLTAVVTVTDDGGSSGRLREEFQILPPGDIRNCMVALAEDEHLLTKLFQYRFESEGDLSGHSFGNLFLAALADVTGDFLEAIKVSSEVLAIKGRIFPSTVQDIALVAELEDGRVICGETNIVESRCGIKRLRLSSDNCQPLPETLDAIEHADIITIGPGSLYTSIIPNLLVDGIVEAMSNSPALKIYICNIMTQPGETDGFDAEDHLRVLFDYSPNLELDYAMVNAAPISDDLREKYLADGAAQVECGAAFSAGLGAAKSSATDAGLGSGLGSGLASGLASGLDGQLQNVCIEAADRTHCFRVSYRDVLHEDGLVRHDPAKLARVLLEIHQTEMLAIR